MRMNLHAVFFLLMTAVVLSGCRTTEPKPLAEEDGERIAARIIATLERDISPRLLSAKEREMLGLLDSVQFDPFPFASHRIYLDQIQDLEAGSATRTYYDYSGNERYSEEIHLESDKLKDYIAALVFTHLDGRSPPHLPKVFHRFAQSDVTSKGMAEPDGKGNE